MTPEQIEKVRREAKASYYRWLTSPDSTGTQFVDGYLARAEKDHAERQALEAKVVMATESAKRLAVAVWTQHYHFDAPSWQPFDDLMGLLSQIDNMVSGLSRSKPAAAQVPDEIAYAVGQKQKLSSVHVQQIYEDCRAAMLAAAPQSAQEVKANG